MSLRNFFSDIEASPWKLFTRLDQSSKMVSCVTPADSVMASYFDLARQTVWRAGSPPSYHSTISVVFLSALHLFNPAT